MRQVKDKIIVVQEELIKKLKEENRRLKTDLKKGDNKINNFNFENIITVIFFIITFGCLIYVGANIANVF